MVRIKSIIDKEVGKFERTLKREYQPYWKPRQFVPLARITEQERFVRDQPERFLEKLQVVKGM